MNRTERIIWLIGVILTLTVMLGIIECRADIGTQAVPVSSTVMESEVSCGRMGQELIDRGDYELAVASLEQSLKIHPRSDWLYSLLGRAYFKMGDLELAEAQFRKALDINKNNPAAKRMVLEMRKTQDLLRDRDFYEWINIAKERAADLVTLVIGVWLGTLLSGISGRFASHFVRTNFRKALAKKDFDYVTDILEDLQIKREKAQLRMRLRELLDAYELEEAKEMIIEYVDDREIEDKLVHFLVQIHKKSQAKG